MFIVTEMDTRARSLRNSENVSLCEIDFNNRFANIIELRMEQGRRGVGGLHSFASNSSLDSLECTQLSADGDLGASHTEPNIKK